MWQTDFTLLQESLKKDLVPAVIGAGACLLFLRSGFLGFFFLVPLGFMAFRYNYTVAWKTLFLAIAGNLILSFIINSARGNLSAAIAWDIMYFSLLASIFTWVIAPFPSFSLKIPGSMRLMLGSCVGAALFIWLFYQAMATPAFTQYIDTMINTILALYQSSGSDVVQNALLQSITAEMVLETMKSILLRGGSLISCVILLFAGRQISMALVRIVYRNSFRDTEGNPVKAGTFSSFHVHPNMIWVLSVSLPMIILVNIFKLEIPEIILWNLLILCGILYLAQGFGIMRFFLAKPAVSPFLRFFLPQSCY